MDITLLALLAVLILALLASMVHRKHRHGLSGDSLTRESSRSTGSTRRCPLCGMMLSPGERVHTTVYSGVPAGHKKVEEAMVHMHGCRYCRPPGGTAQRTCPACKEPLDHDHVVVARLFTTGSRKHLRVLGCPRCRRHGIPVPSDS